MADEKGLEICFASTGRSGAAILTAKLGDEILAVQKVDLTKPKARDAFAELLCSDQPGINRDALDKELLGIAAVVATDSGRPKAKKSTALSDDLTMLPEVSLPGGSVRLTDAAKTLGQLLGATGRFYVRGTAIVRLGSDKEKKHFLELLVPAALPSAFESVARLVKEAVSQDGSVYKQPATCNEQTAKLILHAQSFTSAIPRIQVVAHCPVLIERKDELVQVSGYDFESGILAEKWSIPRIPTADAVELLQGLVADFRFATPYDRSRALAAIMTPALVFGDLLGGRAAVDLGEADDSQAGKGYRNKITAAIYGTHVKTVTQRKGGVGSLEETFNTVLIHGVPFISLDNLRGKVDSPALESFMTEDSYPARIPRYKPVVDIDPRRVIVMMTSNRAEVTDDWANRSSCVRILKQPPGYRFKEYAEGDLLSHVRANRETYLGAVFAIVREWHRLGKPVSQESRHDFRRWAGILDWIVQEVLGEMPIMEGHREAQLRMSNPALNWLRDVVFAVAQVDSLDTWLRTHQLLEILAETQHAEIPGLSENESLDDEKTREKILRAMGRQLGKCFSQNEVIVDAFKVERVLSSDENGREVKEYRMSRIAPHSPRINPAVSRIPRIGSELSENNRTDLLGEDAMDHEEENYLSNHAGMRGNAGNVQESPIRESASQGCRCDRCGCVDYVDVPIHNGQSIRRDCARCGRFMKFPCWYGDEKQDGKTS